MSVLDPSTFVSYTQIGVGAQNKGDLFLKMRAFAGGIKCKNLLIPNAPNIVWGFDASSNPVGIPFGAFFSGNYTDLAGLPTLGTAASASASSFASALDPRLTLASTAIQPAGLLSYATTSYVNQQISLLLGGAPPAALDTLTELAAQLTNDESAAAALTVNVATKLSKAANLSDLADVPTARTNLGLGTAATQATGYFATAAQFIALSGAGFVTAAQAASAAPVQSVNGATGTVTITPALIGAATSAQGALAASALQTQIAPDWNATSGAAAIANKPTIQRTFFNGTAATTPKRAVASTTTASDGSFTITFPATIGFSAAPMCVAQAYATASGLTNTLNANITAPVLSSGAYTVSGWVALLNNSQTITGAVITALSITSAVKAAGAGIVVVVTADGN